MNTSQYVVYDDMSKISKQIWNDNDPVKLLKSLIWKWLWYWEVASEEGFLHCYSLSIQVVMKWYVVSRNPKWWFTKCSVRKLSYFKIGLIFCFSNICWSVIFYLSLIFNSSMPRPPTQGILERKCSLVVHALSCKPYA